MFETDESTPEKRGAFLRSGNRCRAITVSLIFHFLLLTALLCWYVPQHSRRSVPSEDKVSESTVKQQKQFAVSPNPSASLGDAVPASQIEASLKSAMRQAEGLSEERQLSELEKQLTRLNSISSVESVQDTTKKIAETLGLSPGAVPAAESLDGTFDTETAQIHEVTRTRDEKGEWLYQSSLVDAAGRTEKINLPRAEGEVTYNTFQQLKQFPMADGIYRQLVMPLLQNMLSAVDAAEAQARDLRKQKAQEEEEEASQSSVFKESRLPAKIDAPSVAH